MRIKKILVVLAMVIFIAINVSIVGINKDSKLSLSSFFKAPVASAENPIQQTLPKNVAGQECPLGSSVPYSNACGGSGNGCTVRQCD